MRSKEFDVKIFEYGKVLTDHNCLIRSNDGKVASNHPEDFEIVDFTGMYDVNNKKIYDGDRLWCTWNYGGNELERSGTVIFKAPSFVILMETKEGMMPFSFNWFTKLELLEYNM